MTKTPELKRSPRKLKLQTCLQKTINISDQVMP